MVVVILGAGLCLGVTNPEVIAQGGDEVGAVSFSEAESVTLWAIHSRSTVFEHY